ncbi:glycosyltransferase [Aquabacterium sp.]|uniref:glycosyltransferase n=1 Tax=Aquabacterium sp. TaxID=1872578 RepID=UPI001995D503|nr:glycosyltransferase [Aquabacterium sp.]MBC7700935.1 glycosyltransferase [Aquabacterium sp.]
MLNVLVLAHSTALGGAEAALKNSIRLIQQLGHGVTVLLPDRNGEFVTWCSDNRIECLVMPMQTSCPNVTPASFYQISQQDFKHLATQLQKYKIDLVFTNTAVVLHGSVLASVMKKPHVMFVHELMVDSSEMQPSGMPSNSYLRLVARSSDYLLCCSEAVQDQFKELVVDTPCGVLYPYSAGESRPVLAAAQPVSQGDADPFQLLFVGVQSNRKNPVMALAVTQALRLRGHHVVLHCIGTQGPQTPRLQAAIQYRGLGNHVKLHGHTPRPFDVVEGKTINLVCATSEPFGLTITEALERGIPVVASRSGGPQCMLPDSCLFDVDDIDRCVRTIEGVMADYQAAKSLALDNYSKLLPRVSAAHQAKVMATALDTAVERYRDKPAEFFHGRGFFRAINLDDLSLETIAENIAFVSDMPLAEVKRLIAVDHTRMGAAVMADCIKYDVVPFAPSSQMDNLYRKGTGFAIELAATCYSTGRQLMAAFILSKMKDEAASSGRPLRTLAFGDGMGADTLRLAGMGFDVDYMDFDSSVTAAIARKNFESYYAKAGPNVGKVKVINEVSPGQTYDVIVCLEVIEHVSDPMGFLGHLSSLLAEDGLLFISECFDGVQDFWPTHLASIEDMSGLLPMMGNEVGLQLEDCNGDPAGKPYVFRKLSPEQKTSPALVQMLRKNKNLFRNMVRAQLKIGL